MNNLLIYTYKNEQRWYSPYFCSNHENDSFIHPCMFFFPQTDPRLVRVLYLVGRHKTSFPESEHLTVVAFLGNCRFYNWAWDY